MDAQTGPGVRPCVGGCPPGAQCGHAGHDHSRIARLAISRPHRPTGAAGIAAFSLSAASMRARHVWRVSSRPSFTGVAEQEFQIVYVNSDMIARFAQRDVGEVGLVLL